MPGEAPARRAEATWQQRVSIEDVLPWDTWDDVPGGAPAHGEAPVPTAGQGPSWTLDSWSRPAWVQALPVCSGPSQKEAQEAMPDASVRQPRRLLTNVNEWPSNF